MTDYKQRVTEVLREYLKLERQLREHPQAYSSAPPSDPQFITLQGQLRFAKMELWQVTDVEYDEDGLRDKIWEWRFWKVMARRCCWLQTNYGNTKRAGEIMAHLQKAEYEFAKACGLEKEYESPCEAIKKAFPNLTSSPAPESTTTTIGGSLLSAVKNWLAITAL